MVVRGFQGGQDPVMHLRGLTSCWVHEDLEAIAPALGGVKAGSPAAAATMGGWRRLRGIFWELLQLKETPQERCIQPVGPAVGVAWLRPGGHCQAEKGEDSQEDEQDPGG